MKRDAKYAAQDKAITLHDGAYLEYLPDPAIPFRRSRFLATTRIQIAPSATLIYAEILAASRKYYGDGEFFQFNL